MITNDSLKKSVCLLVLILCSLFHFVDAQSDSMIKSIQELEKVVYNSNQPKEERIPALEELIELYMEGEDYQNAMAASEKLIEWAEGDYPKKHLGAIDQKLVALYRLGDFDKAKTVTKESLQAALSYNDSLNIFKGLTRLGVLEQEMQNTEAALDYLLRAESMEIEKQYKLNMATLYNALSITYSHKEVFDSALYYIRKTIDEDLKRMPDSKPFVVNGFSNMAATYIDMEQYDKAIACLDSTLNYDLDSLPDRIRVLVYNNYYEAYWSKDDFEQSEAYFKKYVAVKEGMLEDRLDSELEELKLLHQKENEFIEQKRKSEQEAFRLQRIILFLIIGLLLAALGSVVLFYRNKKKKDRLELEMVKTEQQLLRTQMNPHFIFNTVSVIRSLIRNNDNKRAVKYLTRFSRLMRTILENSAEKMVSLDKELSAIDDYVELQSIRFGQSFEYDLNVDDSIEKEFVSIPPMILQPFIENAIEHGIRGVDQGKIEMNIHEKNGTLHCVIQDNGNGIIMTEAGSSDNADLKGKSLSTSITKQRLEHFGRQFKVDAGLEIYNLQNRGERGTRIELRIPYSEIKE